MSEVPAEHHQVPAWDTADRMRKALRHADIGVQEMADYLGVSRTSASNWINGRIAPGPQTLRLWALRTGVSLEWLAGMDPNSGRGWVKGQVGRGFRTTRSSTFRIRRKFAAA
jgi:transcriptional regulator with XRE-family HTH domain